IDFHLEGLKKLGAKAKDINGSISLTAVNGLRGEMIELPFPSVGATENLMMAATLADGTTVMENCAREPEIVDLAEFLNSMGAEISGAGTSTITIRGVPELHPVNYRIIPDRIETASYLIAGLMTGGDVTCLNASPWHLPVILDKLEETGCELIIDSEKIGIKSPPRPKSIGIKTCPFPGFATDVQPMIMAAMTVADGQSIFLDTIFENRYNQVSELTKMGADIDVKGRVALVNGVKDLNGCEVIAVDIRASMALVIAGLKADGETRIRNLGHLIRGYENPVEKLSNLGADLRIVDENTEKSQTSVQSEEVKKIIQNESDPPVIPTQ
ncbi:UDP-N-acetylglucosamine 1-carboxyvinyltransferase, partial [bacterium]|nr:UDP-N-acetylglucosamine 1-carboxyvinyltransferase [bacterium]MBU1026091.1 UDP-N-acetylglucosamine 1-carboxyvinyltransferase [bacterium]